jgi:hypothetical protein
LIGDDTLTGASDVFSFSFTIWELLTWHHPFVIKRDLSRVSPSQTTIVVAHEAPAATRRSHTPPVAAIVPLPAPLSLANVKLSTRRRSVDETASPRSSSGVIIGRQNDDNESKSLRSGRNDSKGNRSRQSSAKENELALASFPNSPSSIAQQQAVAAAAAAQLIVIPVRDSYTNNGNNDGLLPAAAMGMADARYVPSTISDSRASLPIVRRAPSSPVTSSGGGAVSAPVSGGSSPVPRLIETHHACNDEKGLDFYIRDGLRPPMPAVWPPKLRELLTSCWAHEPLQRPNWHHIITILNQLRQEVSSVEQAASVECRVANARESLGQPVLRPLIVKEIPWCQNDCKRHARWLCLECDLRYAILYLRYDLSINI